MSDNPKEPALNRNRWGAVRIAGIYLVIGSLWILFSDQLAEFLATGPSMLTTISTLKGWGYVFVTAVLLFWLIRREFKELQASNEKVQASEARYRLLAENMTDAVLLMDLDLKVTYASPSLIRLRGFTMEELDTTPLEQQMTPDSLQRALALYHEILSPENLTRPNPRLNSTIELEVYCKDGSKFWSENSFSLICDEKGQPTFILDTARNINDRKQAEQALLEREAQYRAVIETTTDGFWINDQRGRFLEVNDAYVRRSGFSRAELLTMSIADIEVNETPELVSSHIEKVRQLGSDLFETRHRCKNGEVWQLEVNISAWPHGPGMLFGFGRDITERKKAQEEVLRLNAELEQRVMERTAELSDLYNNSPCGYHSLDESGLIVRVNDTELEWLGYTRPEIENKIHFQDLFTPESLQIFQKTFPAFKSRGFVNDLEFDVVRKDGSILSILLSGTAIYDGSGKFLMSRSTMIDNTARKRAEEMMAAYQVKLEAANRELEAFAYSVSHDLRAPLRAIDGFSHIVMEDYAGCLDAEGNRLLAVIRTNTQKMDQLIMDLLALSRVSRIELNFTRIDMTAMARSIYAEIASPETQELFNFSTSTLPDAYGDPTLLRQVWSNLIANAIKYTLPQEERRIEISAVQDNVMNVYSIKDSGVGFNPEYTHKLFGVFQRLHKAEQFEGNGVGLAIVQRIINRHGGTAWAEGKINEGAIFCFSIPRKDSE